MDRLPSCSNLNMSSKRWSPVLAAMALAMPARIARSSLLSNTGGMPPFHTCRNGFEQLDVGVDVLDHLVGPLGVVDQVHVVEDQRFGGRGHVRVAGEVPAAVLRR